MTMGDAVSDGQMFYDQLVALVGCASSADTLACLRGLPAETIVDAVQKMPNLLGYDSFRLPFQPRRDDGLWPEDPLLALAKGKYMKVRTSRCYAVLLM